MPGTRTRYSLKGRANLFLFVSSLIPVVLIGYISYTSMLSLLNNNTDSGIRSSVKHIEISLTNLFNNLDMAALQLAMYNGKLADQLETFFETTDLLVKYEMRQEVIRSISLINAAKSDIGLILFYLEDRDQITFENLSLQKQFTLQGLPVLATGINSTFYGPHPTGVAFQNYHVFSIARKVNLIEGAELYVYMETDIKLFEDLLNSQQIGLDVSYALLNDQGVVMYSQNADVFPVGAAVPVERLQDARKSDRIRSDHYVFAEQGAQGWYILAAVSKQAYNGVVQRWILQFALLALLSLVISLLLGLAIWRTVYRPIREINREIKLMERSRFNSPVRMTGVVEFDSLLAQFEKMKTKIAELFAEIEAKERKKRAAEMENLLHQINPHFLHNTLNTIQWIARMNGQTEIDRLVALFTRVLHYNLGKEGRIVTLGEELEVLQDYLALQQIRYAHQFRVEIDFDEQFRPVVIPRFILQPIVENAIHHGLGEHGLHDAEGLIRIAARRDGDDLLIAVQDNGKGMTDEAIARLLSGDAGTRPKSGLGIGLRYVKQTMELYYGDKASIAITAEPGVGTTFRLRLPLVYREEDLA